MEYMNKRRRSLDTTKDKDNSHRFKPLVVKGDQHCLMNRFDNVKVFVRLIRQNHLSTVVKEDNNFIYIYCCF